MPEPIASELGVFAWQPSPSGALLVGLSPMGAVVWSTRTRRPLFASPTSSYWVEQAERFAWGNPFTVRNHYGSSIATSEAVGWPLGASGEWLASATSTELLLTRADLDPRYVRRMPWAAEDVATSLPFPVLPSPDGKLVAFRQAAEVVVYGLENRSRHVVAANSSCARRTAGAFAWAPSGQSLLVAYTCLDSQRPTNDTLVTFYPGGKARTLSLPQRGTNSLTFDAGGRTVVAASDAHSATLDVRPGMRAAPDLRIVRSGVAANAIAGLTLLADGRLLESSTGQKRALIPGTFEAWSADGKWLATKDDQNVYVHDTFDGRLQRSMRQRDFIPTRSFGPRFVSGTSELIYEEQSPLRRAMQWSTDGSVAALAPATRLPISDVAFAGDQLVVGAPASGPNSLDLGGSSVVPHVTRFDLERLEVSFSRIDDDLSWAIYADTGLVVRQRRLHHCEQWRVGVAPGLGPASAPCEPPARDGGIRLRLSPRQIEWFDVASGRKLGSATRHGVDFQRLPASATYSDDGHYFATKLADSLGGALLLGTGLPSKGGAQLELPGIARVLGFMRGADLPLIADDGRLIVLDAEQTLRQRTIVASAGWSPVHIGAAANVALSPDGARMAWATPHGASTWQRVAAAPVQLDGGCDGGSEGQVRSTETLRFSETPRLSETLRFSEDGELLALLCPNGVTVWAVRSRRVVFRGELTWLDEVPSATQVAFHGGGRLLAIADRARVHLLDLAQRQHMILSFSRLRGVDGETQWWVNSADGLVDGDPTMISMLNFPSKISQGRLLGAREAEAEFGVAPIRTGLMRHFVDTALHSK